MSHINIIIMPERSRRRETDSARFSKYTVRRWLWSFYYFSLLFPMYSYHLATDKILLAARRVHDRNATTAAQVSYYSSSLGGRVIRSEFTTICPEIVSCVQCKQCGRWYNNNIIINFRVASSHEHIIILK